MHSVLYSLFRPLKMVGAVLFLLHNVALSQDKQNPHQSTINQTLSPIVFVSRNPLPNADGALPGMGPRYRTAKVGGRLMLREQHGKLRVLVGPSQLYDVADPCVSWNAKLILFSGVSHPDSNWRIYQINADGSGLRQLTFSDRKIDLTQFGPAAEYFARYDDFDPAYLPDGRVVFASTRYPSLASFGQLPTSNLSILEGGSIHRITTERNGGEEPTVDPSTGRIVYARWWVNVDRPSDKTPTKLTRDDRDALTSDIANIWHAISVNTDGTELRLYAGFPRTRFGTQTYKPSLLDDGTLLSVFAPQTSMMSMEGGTGIRWFKKGADIEHYILGVCSHDSLMVNVHACPPYATDAVQLSGRTILCSYSRDGKDYGVYSCSLDGKNLKTIVDLSGTLELEPQVLRPRRVPPVLKDYLPPPFSELPPTEDPSSIAKTDLFRFDCMNIFITGAVDEPIPDAPRLTTGARIRFFTNPQRQGIQRPDVPIFLKEVAVFTNGGVHEPELPADVPLFEQVVDRNGNVLSTPDGKFAHVPGFNFERIGGGTKCAGCHAGHSMLTVPINGSLAEWFNASPSAMVTPSSMLVEKEGVAYPGQRVVDRRAQTGGDTVSWVANEGSGAFLLLQWDRPLEVREFRLYNINLQTSRGTTIVVHDSEILLYYHSNEVGRVPSTGPLNSKGTSIKISPTVIDAAKIVIKKFSGTFHRRAVAGLAEVETIARIRNVQ